MAVLVALCLATSAVSGAAAHAASYTLPGRDVALYDLTGTVRVEPATGTAVTAEVTVLGRDAGRLRIETGVLGGRQTLRVMYPKGDVVYPGHGSRWSNSTVSVREDGRFSDGTMQGLSALFQRHVRIKGSGRGTEAHADIVVRVPPGLRVAIYNGVGTISATNVNAELRLDGCATTVDTHNTRGGLTVDVGSGEVTVDGADGALLVDTGSGDVRVSRVKATTVKLDTGSGRVEGAQIKATSLVVDTGSGGVRLSGVDAQDVHCDTGSGPVTLEMLGQVGNVRIDTGSGGVILDVPPDTGARLSADCGSGEVSCDLPLRIRQKDENSLSGCIGDCRGTILIDTGSGDVHVRSRGVSHGGPGPEGPL